jgi:lysophospholipid acyltransferase (LPLAT)-like uncharacterized protein
MQLLNSIAPSLVNLISKTWRIKTNGDFPPNPSIVVFWHGSMLPVWKMFENKSPIAVVSQSKDGQLLSDLLEKWGFSLIRGSSSRGAKEVMLSIIKNAPNRYVLMTPDGPKGPANELKPGAIVAAFRANVPIVFANVKIHSRKQFLKSWDKFQFPYPFSKCEVAFSDKILIPKDSSRDEINNIIQNIQSLMNA